MPAFTVPRVPTGPALLTFLVATLALLLMPGPSVLYVMARSLDQGRRAGLWSMLGLETGALLHVVAAVVGLTALLASSTAALHTVRWAGAAYLLYLGARQLLQPQPPWDGTAPVGRTQRLYLDGVLIDLLNPKTALFFIAFLPQFVDARRGSASMQILVLGLVFVALAVVCDSSYVVTAGLLSGWIRRSPRVQRHLSRSTGVVYVALAVAAAISPL